MSLELHVELRPGLVGVATITNRGTEPIRLWQTGSELGDAPWRFELGDGRFISDDVYTRDAPTATEIAAGGTLSRPFELRDGTWRAEGEVDGAAALVGVYEVPVTPEAAEQGVWAGTLRSAPVPIT